jgi:hypothetical protein
MIPSLNFTLHFCIYTFFNEIHQCRIEEEKNIRFSKMKIRLIYKGQKEKRSEFD